MGWRNLFIKITKDDTNESSSIETLNKFIDHHNNWYNYFSDTEIKEMEDEDTVPGENIIPYFFSKNGEEVWANVGNHGGSDWTEMWVEKYFSSIKIYNSSNWPHYNGEDWTKWPVIKDLSNFF